MTVPLEVNLSVRIAKKLFLCLLALISPPVPEKQSVKHVKIHLIAKILMGILFSAPKQKILSNVRPVNSPILLSLNMIVQKHRYVQFARKNFTEIPSTFV